MTMMGLSLFWVWGRLKRNFSLELACVSATPSAASVVTTPFVASVETDVSVGEFGLRNRVHSTCTLGSVREAVTFGTENLNGHDAGNGGYSQGDT